MSTIKVFEHEFLEIDDVKFQKRHWEALSKFNVKNDCKYFTLYPDGIKFHHYVGCVQAGNLTIEILPKADKKSPVGDKNQWHNALIQMLKECQYLKIDEYEQAKLELTNGSVLDAFMSLFITEVEKILHRGLVKQYRRKTGNQPSLKGKLLFQGQIIHNLIHKERFYVSYTVYDSNHLIHRILYKTIRLVANVSTHPDVKGKSQRILLDFPELNDVNVNEETFDKLHLPNKFTHYKESLLLSKILLLNYQPSLKAGIDHVVSLLFNMNALWEEYVYRQLLKLNADWVITKQQSVDFWETKSFSKTLRPDIIIRAKDDKTIIVDTKWKLLEDNMPSDDDLRQMFAYAHYLDSTSLILLYPAEVTDRISGKYSRIHTIANKQENISCATLSVPLKFNESHFIGLELSSKLIY